MLSFDLGRKLIKSQFVSGRLVMTKTGGGSGVAEERRCRYGFNTIDVVLLVDCPVCASERSAFLAETLHSLWR